MHITPTSGLFTAASPPLSIPADAVRKTIKEQPGNIGRLARAAVVRLNKTASSGQDKQIAINAASVLIVILPVLFEDEHEHHMVHNIFWAGVVPGASQQEAPLPLAQPLMDAVLVLLTKPTFACDGQSLKPGTPLSACTVAKQYDAIRTVLLKLSKYIYTVHNCLWICLHGV